jgi:hypothetical protein
MALTASAPDRLRNEWELPVPPIAQRRLTAFCFLDFPFSGKTVVIQMNDFSRQLSSLLIGIADFDALRLDSLITAITQS